MLLLTLHQVLKLFLFLLVGFVLRRLRAIPETTAGNLSKLEVNLFLPALTFLTFCHNFTVQTLVSDPQLLLAGIISITATCAVGTVIGRHISRDHYTQNLTIYSINVPNTGYMGTPLVLAMFGEATLMKNTIFNLPMSFYTYSEGFHLLLDDTRKGKSSWKSFLNPPLIAMLVGAVFGILQIPLPALAEEVLSSCGDCMGPLGMLLTGCVIAEFRLRDVLRELYIYEVVFCRMVAIPAVTLFIAKMIGLGHDTMVAMVSFFAMPTGLNSVILPASQGRDCHLGAGMACISNLLGILTIPLFYALFL